MTFQDTQTMDLELLSASAGGLAEFSLGTPAEILLMLRKLVDGSVIVHINTPDGTSYSTTLWMVDRDSGTMAFSIDAGDPRPQRLAEADELVVVGYLDSVKIQFDVVGAVVVNGRGGSVLRAPIPRVLYRFQRRRSFRVRPLASSSPVARMHHPAAPGQTLVLRVLDVSLGGCALFLPSDAPPLDPGTLVPDVSIDLDAETRFTVSLQLHHVTSLNPQAGGVRLGCSMVSLGAQAERLLQRYIDQTQKRRRMFSLD
jgi:c-di-GMP-binding flagellar brake protein YcgR